MSDQMEGRRDFGNEKRDARIVIQKELRVLCVLSLIVSSPEENVEEGGASMDGGVRE